MIALLRRHNREDDGLSLVEVLVSMILIGVLGGLVVAAFSSLAQTQVRVSDESQGLQDVQTVVERLSRDLRSARGVDATANANQLTIWIDSNSDYVQTPAETITWKLRLNAVTDHYDVLRVDGNNVQIIEGRTAVSEFAFVYNATPVNNTTVVTVDMRYDPIKGGFATSKQAQFQVRMRNVQ